MAKFVFVTGGVVSGLGKGITASSVALLLKAHGYKVFMQKFDPYINVDPGTMSPYQHGEVFVTADGSETDLDLGHYERFIDEEMNYTSNITLGRVLKSVIDRERHGDFLGGTVQIVPHVTDGIKHKVYEAASSSGADIVITEVGGTIGDIESQPFLEALRQVRLELPASDTLFIHTTLVPSLFGSGELKTKPTQHSVIELRGTGIQPDIIVCRTSRRLDPDTAAKVALFCSVPADHVISSVDVGNIYEIPLLYHSQKIDDIVLKKLRLTKGRFSIRQWSDLVRRVNHLRREVRVALVGKYTSLNDAYISVVEALRHAGYGFGAKVTVDYIDSEKLEGVPADVVERILGDYKGIVVPGGFGNRGVEGMIAACSFARTRDIPYLGLCLGMQVAAIEFARNVCGLKGANSTEFDKDTPHPVVSLLEEQRGVTDMGGTLRLGNYDCSLKPGSMASRVYGSTEIVERHRHRYEFNNNYIDDVQSHGMTISGVNPKLNLAELVEIPSNRFFMACQFHPEFRSRPVRPHPLFAAFVEECVK